jgi:predicted small secreted protein
LNRFGSLVTKAEAKGATTQGRHSMETMMHKIATVLTLLALVGAAPLLAACQTTAGVGRDLSNGGHALTNSAEKNAPPGDRHY